MRILHIANFSWFPPSRKRMDNWMRYYATDHKISNGLIRNGHSVWNFSYRDSARYLSPLVRSKKMGSKAMNAAIIHATRLFQPHLILLGHCELIDADTLAVLRDMLPNCKIAQWWVDGFDSHSIPYLREKQPYLDAFFSTIAPSYYEPLIGGDNSPALYYMPNIVDSSIETERSFAGKKHDYDVLFIGTGGKNAEKRILILEGIQKLAGIRAGLFGFNEHPTINGSALPKTIGKSKIGLNISREINIPLCSSDRISQLVGNGCLVLTPRTPLMAMLFEEKEVAYYSDTEELLSHIQDYGKDDIAWRKIAEAGWQRAHRSYNERRIAQYIVEAAMNHDFSESYEWLFAAVSAKISENKTP